MRYLIFILCIVSVISNEYDVALKLLEPHRDKISPRMHYLFHIDMYNDGCQDNSPLTGEDYISHIKEDDSFVFVTDKSDLTDIIKIRSGTEDYGHFVGKLNGTQYYFEPNDFNPFNMGHCGFKMKEPVCSPKSAFLFVKCLLVYFY